MPTNDDDTVQPGQKVWALTQEWMGKISSAYESYTAERTAYRKLIALSLGLIFAVMIIGAVGDELIKRNYGPGSTLDVVWNAVSIVLIFMIFGIAIATLVRRYLGLRTTKADLADLFSIADELFQMVISTEEKNAGNKYEYLVNHIRVLEIKHLLEKVRKVTTETLSPFPERMGSELRRHLSFPDSRVPSVAPMSPARVISVGYRARLAFSG